MTSTLRDLARFGALFTPSGRAGIIPDGHLTTLQERGRPHLRQDGDSGDFSDSSTRHNTYQWDRVTVDGDLFKSGKNGQGLYISPRRDLVVAYFATDGDARKAEIADSARQLATSQLF